MISLAARQAKSIEGKNKEINEILAEANRQLIKSYDDNETGAGTSVDPYQATIGDATATALSIVGFRVTGVRYDGQTILADLTNCSVTPTGAIQLGAKNSATAIGFQGKASYITYRQYT